MKRCIVENGESDSANFPGSALCLMPQDRDSCSKLEYLPNRLVEAAFGELGPSMTGNKLLSYAGCPSFHEVIDVLDSCRFNPTASNIQMFTMHWRCPSRGGPMQAVVTSFHPVPIKCGRVRIRELMRSRRYKTVNIQKR